MKELGFIPNINMIRMDKSHNIPRLVKRWLNDNNRLEQVAQNGYDLIQDRHTTKVRAKELITHLKAKL